MADMAAVSHPRRVPRPGAVPAAAQVQRDHGFRSNQNFQPLPKPTGAYPYRLRLDQVLAPSAVSAIQSAGELAFHLVGDTGGVKNPQPQQTVADHMGQDFSGAGTPAPSFFYHLGDVVYFYGQSSEYYPQFYEPYSLYPAPIMGIPGNHDGDPGAPATEPSLAGFVNNFCADRPHLTRDAQEIHRDAMTQPHVYWTLLAPFLTIIGLYTNVPEGGLLDNDQIAWLEAELSAAPTDGALIVAMHHPPYSADAHHGGSAYMGGILDQAVRQSGRTPNAVVTGHVHNYQRFTRRLNGRDLPYIVAGAGGYWHLHSMALDESGQPLSVPWQVPGSDATLEQYCADRHGYLRVSVTPDALRGEYIAVPGHLDPGGPVETKDSFAIDLKSARISAPAGSPGPDGSPAPPRSARTRKRSATPAKRSRTKAAQ